MAGDVVRGEGSELAATQCGGKPEEEDRTVTLAGRGLEIVHRADDLTHQDGRQWSGPARRCGPKRPAGGAERLSDSVTGGGIAETFVGSSQMKV